MERQHSHAVTQVEHKNASPEELDAQSRLDIAGEN